MLIAGLGEPSPERCKQAHHITNLSRVLSAGKDPYAYRCEYLLNRRPIKRSVPLTVGILWHQCLEFLADMGWDTSEVAVYAVVAKARKGMNEQLALLGEEDGDLHEKLMEGMKWIERALLEYVKTYPDGPPSGRTIAIEIPFWLLDTTSKVMLLGRLDRLSMKGNLLLDADMKTVNDRADLGKYFKTMLTSYQRRCYGLGLATVLSQGPDQEVAPEWQPTLEMIYGAKWFGSALDIARKAAHPTVPNVRINKDGSPHKADQRRLDEYPAELEAWSGKLFAYIESVYKPDVSMDRFAEICEHTWIEKAALIGGAHTPAWSSMYTDVWHGDIDLSDDYYFQDREPDYVDRARALQSEA